MGLRLTVSNSIWRAHIAAITATFPNLVPVVKGNGYGFGRSMLISIVLAATNSQELAVGTVYEVNDVPNSTIPIVLTPAIDPLPHDLHPKTR